jgi:hypothetical protein
LYRLSSGLDGSVLVSWGVAHDRGETLYDAPLLASGRWSDARAVEREVELAP